MTKGITPGGYPLPDVIAPPKTRCVVFEIPDNTYHIAAFWGAVGALGKWVNWQKESTKSGVLVANVWDDVIAKARETFDSGDCGQDCECEECEECTSTGTIAGGKTVGALGLTIEEMEMLLMGSLMDIKIENGNLYKQVFPCCDWVLVGSVATILGTSTAQPTNLKDAIAQGISNFTATLKPVTNPVPELNNAWTIKCLKATSLKYIVQTYLTEIKDAVNSAQGDYTDFFEAASIFLAVTPLKFIAPIAGLAYVVSKYGFTIVSDQITSLLANNAIWDDFVCDYADIMSGAESFTGEDLSAWYDNFVVGTIQASEAIVELLDNIAPGEFQSRVNENIAAVTCECSEYLPNGYQPPIAGFHFLHDSFGSDNTAGNASYEFDNATPFNAVYGLATKNIGLLVGDYARSIYYTEQSLIKFDKFVWVVALSDPAVISQVEISYALQGYCEMSGIHVDLFDAVQNKWVHGGSAGSNAPVPSTREFNMNIANVTHVVIQGFFGGQYNTGNRCIATVTSLKLSGVSNGNPFTDLELGASDA